MLVRDDVNDSGKTIRKIERGFCNGYRDLQ